MKLTGLTDFIIEHGEDDVSRLLLSRGKWPEVDMDLAVCTIEGRKRLRRKVPDWYGVPSLVYPDRLCTEQCSSGDTAMYKAELANRISGGGRIADLTGGLGIDCWAFSKSASAVLHNEMKKYLSEAAEHNFKELGISNIKCVSHEVKPGNAGEILDGFSPDLIFLDPARRDSAGKKVFLLEDCCPDILGLRDELLALAPSVLVKLSPMADITMAVSRLGSHVREIHVVASGGECKELLVWLDRGWNGGDPSVTVRENGCTVEFGAGAEAEARAVFVDTEENLEGTVLFEPGKALAKSGMFNAVSERFGLRKLGISTHLYIGADAPEGLGKRFNIIVDTALNNKSIKELGKRFQLAEVSARNIPLTSDALRKKLGVRSGGTVHIFGVRIGSENRLLVTERLS